MSERRLAVIDLGSNSFRLVVFSWSERTAHPWWRRTDEIHEPVRIGAGLDAAGELGAEPMDRALETIELFAHFCRATGIGDVRAQGLELLALDGLAGQEALRHADGAERPGARVARLARRDVGQLQ